MKRSFLIYFLGMDGSGKSTLSDYLSAELRNKGYSVSSIWWFEGDNSLIRKLIRIANKNMTFRIIDNPLGSDLIETPQNGFLSNIFKFVYPNIVLLDYLRFGILNAWLPKYIGENKIIIVDRFMYDVILALSKEFNFSYNKISKLFKIFNRLLPKPDLIFGIDISPEISYSRKKDEFSSLENARLIWNDYQRLYSIIGDLVPGKIIKIDNRQSIELVKEQILKNTLALIET